MEIEIMALPVSVKDSFLERLAETGNVSEASRAVGVSRVAAYQWRWADPEIANRWDVAMAASRESLRERVVETAVAMSLARMVPKLDEAGCPVLDDNFDQVMALDTSGVEARVLMKMMDKLMREETRTVEQRTTHAGSVTYEHVGPVDVVLVEVDGTETSLGRSDDDDDRSAVMH